MPMTLSITIAKFKFCQYKGRVISPNFNACIVTHYDQIYKIIVVCPSVTGGQQKRFDLEM